MSDLQTRLDQIRQRITSDDFLQGRGLGNDVPFYAFDYPPTAERRVSDHIDLPPSEWLASALVV